MEDELYWAMVNGGLLELPQDWRQKYEEWLASIKQ